MRLASTAIVEVQRWNRPRVPRAPRHLVIGVAVAFLGVTTAHGQVDSRICGPLTNAFGPYDYRTVRDQRLTVVEHHHFNSNVELLIRGQTDSIGADLFYVLRAFPNHHRALITLARLAKRSKAMTIPKMEYPVECFFERAVRFRRDDTTARMLYASFLHDNGRSDEALKHIDEAIAIAPDQPFTQYNAGMMLMDFGAHERALVQAHKAMALGFERNDLRLRLEAAGKWQDPASVAPVSTHPASSPLASPAASGSLNAVN